MDISFWQAKAEARKDPGNYISKSLLKNILRDAWEAFKKYKKLTSINFRANVLVREALEYMENSLFVDLVDENKKFYHDSCVPAPTHFLWYFFIVAA